jgi:hypothetical protein
MAAVVGRHTRQFFNTVGGLTYYESIRSDFLDYFESVEEYCVSVECNHVDNKCHIHAYLSFSKLMTDFVGDVMGGLLAPTAISLRPSGTALGFGRVNSLFSRFY